MDTVENVKDKHQEKDCWGYAVCFGTVITFIAGIGHVNSFGLIYNDFMIDTKSTAKSLTTAHGVFAIMLAVGGIILNIMAKKISLRLCGVIGSIAFTLGSFLTIFISNTNQLPITFGLLQGMGFGMMVTASYSMINYYYVRKRTTVMSAVKAVQGLVQMWHPQLLKQIMYHYGFRGTLLIIFGISLHTFPGMIVMEKSKTSKNQLVQVQRVRTANNVENDISRQETENEDLLHKHAGVGVKIRQANNVRENLRSKILDILNLKVLKDPVYRNICLGQSFVNFSDLTFFVLQPMLLFQYGFETSEVATCISICAGADVMGRFTLALVSNITHINTRVLFYAATLLTFVFRIVILQVHKFTYVAIVTGLLGMLRAWLHVASPLVISNHVSNEDFPGAYALFMLAAGVVNVACSPVVGLLKDIYQDYIPTFYALTLCCVPCLLTWPIEYFILRKRPQNSQVTT